MARDVLKPGGITAVVLLSGVVVSCFLLVLGLTTYFAGNANLGNSFLITGLLVLLGTPFVRIVVLATELSRRGEYAFVVIAAGVLLLLVISVLVGLESQK